MAAQVASSEIKTQIKKKVTEQVDKIENQAIKNRIQQAKILAEGLSQLKGAAMKVGQMLSIDAADILPPEATAILSKLQSEAEPVDFDQMDRVLRSELKNNYKSVQLDSQTPLASASIGQVYKAKYNDQNNIVLKVQYPGIADSIDNDIRLVKNLIEKSMIFTGKKMNLDPTFEEVVFVLKSEADYLREKAMVDRARELLNTSTIEGFRIPQTIAPLCTKKVLAMSLETGVPLLKWIDSEPPLSERLDVGRKMLNLFLEEFLNWRLVQTDPNFGNFLIDTEHDNQIVLLDYGSTLEYTTEFVDEYIRLLTIAKEGDPVKVTKEAVNFGILDPRESEEAKVLFIEMLKLALLPFTSPIQPFQFSDPKYNSETRKIIFKFTQSLKYSPPPRKILFLHRKLGGLFSLLKRMDVEIDLSEYWNKILDHTAK